MNISIEDKFLKSHVIQSNYFVTEIFRSTILLTLAIFWWKTYIQTTHIVGQ